MSEAKKIADEVVRYWQGTAEAGNNYRGEKVNKAKLKEWQVREIRAMKGKATQQAVGDLYGVSQHAIGCIWRGQKWKHVQ